MNYRTPVLASIYSPIYRDRASAMIHPFPIWMDLTIWWRTSDPTLRKLNFKSSTLGKEPKTAHFIFKKKREEKVGSQFPRRKTQDVCEKLTLLLPKPKCAPGS